MSIEDYRREELGLGHPAVGYDLPPVPVVPAETDGTTGTTEVEQSWSDRLLSQARELDATALAKQAIEAATEAEDEEDPDKMNVVPNRQAQRDAANLRGSARVSRSRIRRRIHRVLVKRGTWK